MPFCENARCGHPVEIKQVPREPTSPLLITLKALKCKDLVQTSKWFKTVTQQKSLKFQMRERQHDLGGICMFKKQLVRTNAKYYCFIIVKRVVWL